MTEEQIRELAIQPGKLAKVVAQMVNIGGIPHKEFIEQMGREHRWLQNSFTFLVVMPWLQYLATLNDYDERNAMAVDVARRMMRGRE